MRKSVIMSKEILRAPAHSDGFRSFFAGNALVALGNAIADGYVTDDELARHFFGSHLHEVKILEAAQWQSIADQLRVDFSAFRAGGSVCNSAVWFHHWRGAATFLGAIANDAAGHAVASDLRHRGVDARLRILDVPEGTGRCLVYVSADGERTMITTLGAALHTGVDDLDAAPAVNSPDSQDSLLLLEGYALGSPGAQELVAELERWESGRRLAISLSDPAMVPHIHGWIHRLLSAGVVDILIGNLEEYRALLSTSPGTSGTSEDWSALGEVTRAVRSMVVITAGADGALVIDKTGEHKRSDGQDVATDSLLSPGNALTAVGKTLAGHPGIGDGDQPSCVVCCGGFGSQARDTTGAGDCFAGTLLAGLCGGGSLLLSLRLACVAAGTLVEFFSVRPDADVLDVLSQRMSTYQLEDFAKRLRVDSR